MAEINRFGGVWEVVLESVAISGRPVVNVFHYRNPETGTGMVKSAVKDAWLASDLSSALQTALNQAYQLARIRVRWIDDATDPYGDWSPTWEGTNTGQMMPLDVAVYCKLQTDLRGQEYRGSKHFAPMTETDSVGNELVNDGLNVGLTNWLAVRAGLLVNISEPVSGGELRPVVLSRKLSQLETNPTTVSDTQISAVNLNLTIGTMRHRRERTQIATIVV